MNAASAHSAVTLERLIELFGGYTAGGEFVDNHNRAIVSIDIGPPNGLTSCHIIVDAEEPDGFRMYCRQEKKIPALEDIIRAKLGLTPKIRPANDNAKSPTNVLKIEDDTIDGDTLMQMEFQPLSYVIPGYVVEGLTVLGGKPKLGKSWWAYDAAIAVATGGRAMGKVECEQGDCLYLALEDNRRRMKDRINVLRPLSKKRGGLDRLKVRTIAPRIDAGLLDELEKWRSSVPNPRLIIIDVYMKVRPTRKRNEDSYAADYAAVIPLQRYASEHRLAIVLVTHTRKMEAEDPLESISGTNGITGAADAVLVLSRSAKGMTLYGRGRDIEEIETAMKFDGGRWTVLGDAAEVHRSAERRKILEALETAGKPVGPKEISELSGLPYVNVRAMLIRMAKAGEVSRAGRGLYSVGHNGHNDHNDTKDHNVTTEPAATEERAAA